jgi:hypothetical protein
MTSTADSATRMRMTVVEPRMTAPYGSLVARSTQDSGSRPDRMEASRRFIAAMRS